MSAFGPYGFYIAASYLLAALAIGGLVAWIAADRRALSRAMAELEARGVRRRSDRAPGEGEAP